MSKHVVNVPDASSRRLMSAAQWLAEYQIVGRSHSYRLPAPLTFRVATPSGSTIAHRCRTSLEVFRRLGEIAREDGMIVSATWAGHKLYAHGIYALNFALRSAAVRAGGRNLVRHWLEEISRVRTPLPGHWESLLAFLEIRPISSQKTCVSRSHAKHYVLSKTRLKRPSERRSGQRPP